MPKYLQASAVLSSLTVTVTFLPRLFTVRYWSRTASACRSRGMSRSILSLTSQRSSKNSRSSRSLLTES